MERLAPPPPFKLNYNQVESWNLWRQRFQLYMYATSLNSKPEIQKLTWILKKRWTLCGAAETSELQAQVYFTVERNIDVVKRFKPSPEVKPTVTVKLISFDNLQKNKKVPEENVSTVGAVTFQVDVQPMVNSAGAAGSGIIILVHVCQDPSTGHSKIVQGNLPIPQITCQDNNSLLVL
ncbi:hypothetical protein AVEN_252887-1 [Araneus ventricosus]|uniref:Uncharacterized protein n=1 Tax=Araneus ventricosus TaxID=182803 RepID=A0A4Y2KYY6_ARAVE|nr:hypothetical protein AVEN_252887-1 [Araneus ventricosus]